MTEFSPHRRLAAILYADVVGYSRLMGADETGTHRRLRALREAVFKPQLAAHQGRTIRLMGDGTLVEFSSVVDALACAVDVQQAVASHNAEIDDNERIVFRIGINLGDIIVDDEDIHGDGVNVAARLEGLADPGGICISGTVYDAIGNKLPSLNYAFMGEQRVKNIVQPVRAYRVLVAAAEAVKGVPSCPYPGMVPFSAAEARYFYGREEEIARMVQLLRRQRFLMVIGPSGSGKSSLVYAGLLPELEKSRYFKPDYWLIRTMRPGLNPTTALANVIGTDTESGDFEIGSIDALLQAHPPAQRLLLLVDQFEEVFTQVGREQRARFIAGLQAIRAPANCALILTLRADFYPDLMNSYLWPVDASQRVEVAPLRGETLRAAIEKPAADVGVRIEDSLVTQLLADAADEPGVLPLLQETMGLLWDEMEHRTLSLSVYQHLSEQAGFDDSGRISGLAVAIAMKADATLMALSPAQQAIARRIFLRLIQFGEGRADTRRQQPVAALRAATDQPGELEQTLEHLTDHRLLTRSGGEGGHPPAVDISHEALINGWTRLQDWADERRETEQIRRRLEGKAAEWVRLGKGNGGLLSDVELPEAEHWLASADAKDLGYDTTLPALVHASQQAIADAEEVREAARQRELEQAQVLAEEQRQRIADQIRAAGRMRRSMIGLAVVFVVAVAAAIVAWMQSQEAQRHAKQAETRRLEAQQASEEANRLAQAEAAAREEAERARLSSIAQLLLIEARQQQAVNLDERGALLARQAYLIGAKAQRSVQEQVDGVLRTVVGKPYFSATLSTWPANSFAFSPDGLTMASTHRLIGKVLLWDRTRLASEPKSLSGFPGDKDAGTGLPLSRMPALAFSPDGKTLVGGNIDGTLGRWDLDRPDKPFEAMQRQRNGIWSLAFSSKDKILAVGSRLDDAVRVWDLTTPDAEPVLLGNRPEKSVDTDPASGQPYGTPVAFSPDGKTLANGRLDGSIELWQLADLVTPIETLYGHDRAVWALAFSPGGEKLASAGADDSIRIWDLGETSAAPLTLKMDQGGVISVAFSPDGQSLVAASQGQWAQLWQWQNPAIPPVILSDSDWRPALFSPDGAYIMVGGGDGAQSGFHINHLTPSGRPTVLRGHHTKATSVAFSSDGAMLASGGGALDKTIRLWDLNDQPASSTILGKHSSNIPSVAFSPDDQNLLSVGTSDNTVRLWQLDQPNSEIAVLSAQEPWAATFSSDGTMIASSAYDGVYLWRTADLSTPSAIFRQPTDWVGEIAFSANSRMLAMPTWDGGIYLQDLTTPRIPGPALHGHEAWVWSVAFSPDDRWLASGGKDTQVRLWNLRDPLAPAIVLGSHNDQVTRVRFSPDGKLLASAGVDFSVRLWNVENPDALPIVLSGHEGEVWGLAYSPDGKTLASAGADISSGNNNTILLWDLTHPLNSSTTESVANSVCPKVLRNLTLDEWHQFVGEDIPYERTCPNRPIHPSLFETAEKLAREGDKAGAIALLERAIELEPELDLKPQEEVERWTMSAEQ